MTKTERTIKAILNRAAKIIDRGWVRNKTAVDKNGKLVSAASKKAVAFCATGAIDRASVKLRKPSLYHSAYLTAGLAFPEGGIVYFNDHKAKTRRQVSARLRRAAKLVGWKKAA